MEKSSQQMTTQARERKMRCEKDKGTLTTENGKYIRRWMAGEEASRGEESAPIACLDVTMQKMSEEPNTTEI